MIQLPHIKARIERPKQLTQGLAKEVTSWKSRKSPLLPLERRCYLDGLQDVVKGLDDARHALAVAAGARGG